MQTNNAWYAVTTRTGWEAKARADLCREHVITWLPRNKVRTVRKTKSGPQIKWIEKPAYPRYLFVSLPSTQWWLVRKAKCRFVALDPVEDDDGFVTIMPTVIPNQIMKVLMAGFDDTGLAHSKAQVTRARFKAMQSVRFTDGPLKDALLKVIEDDGSDSIRVLVKLFGSERTVTVRVAELEAA